MRITFMRPAITTAAIVAAAGLLAGGLALRPAFAVVGPAMVNPDTSCNNSTKCKSYKNSGTGVGLLGSNSNASTAGAGLLGTATGGGIGVSAQANTGPAVLANSASGGDGVFGLSNGAFGVEGQTAGAATTGAAVQGDNNSTTTAVRANGFGGLLFDGNNSSAIDVFTVDNGGNATILGSEFVNGNAGSDALDAGTPSSFRGVGGAGFEGLAGFGEGAGGFGAIGFNYSSSGGEAITAEDVSGTGVLYTGFDSGSNLKFEVADDGTVFAHNFIIAFDTPSGHKATAYATMSSTPNIEDFGEAQLTGGQAYVSLKRSFGGEIDSRTSYLVFITPEGDTRGLYVTQKTPAGFVVRENQGGRSDATFSYRIVAKPAGSAAPAMRSEAAPSHVLRHMPTFHHVPKSETKLP